MLFEAVFSQSSLLLFPTVALLFGYQLLSLVLLVLTRKEGQPKMILDILSGFLVPHFLPFPVSLFSTVVRWE